MKDNACTKMTLIYNYHMSKQGESNIHIHNRFLSVSVNQIHLQNFSWSGAVVEDTCPTFHTLGLKPESRGWGVNFLPHSPNKHQ